MKTLHLPVKITKMGYYLFSAVFLKGRKQGAPPTEKKKKRMLICSNILITQPIEMD